MINILGEMSTSDSYFLVLILVVGITLFLSIPFIFIHVARRIYKAITKNNEKSKEEIVNISNNNINN